MVSHPIDRSGTDPLSSPAPASQGITACGGLCLELLLQGLPSCHHTLLENRGQVCNQPAQEEAARLPMKCVYYLLDCKVWQTNFPNLWGQIKPEEIGGTRMKSTRGLWKCGNDAPYCQTTAKLHSQMPPNVIITNSYLINLFSDLHPKKYVFSLVIQHTREAVSNSAVLPSLVRMLP